MRNPFANEPKQQSDLGKLVMEQASAMNQTMMNGYDAGLQEGFRRGIAAAADCIGLHHAGKGDTFTDVLSDIMDKIRALKP